jgi:acyl transferase domain-containing protein
LRIVASENRLSWEAEGIDGQADAIKKTYAPSGIKPESISYVEAHGTATSIGDAIETEALTKAFGGSRYQQKLCALGSVKTNIGYLDTAAGIAGFIKTVLALKHKTIPTSLHFTRLNPHLNLDDTPFYINDTLST